MSTRSLPACLAVLAWIAASGCGGASTRDAQAESKSSPGTAESASTASSEGSAPGFGTSKIHGKVVFEGTPPAPTPMKMDTDAFCSTSHPDGATTTEYVVGPDGGLKWVFVYVKEGLSETYETPIEPVVLDQKDCIYIPHVFGIMVGQPLKILNNDDTLHNVHSLPKNSRQFNLAMPRMGMEFKKKFRKPEVMVRIKCDVHPWMESWAGVLSHPFHSVSGDDGSFSLDRLPAGTYTIEAVHEDGGSQTQSVTLGDGEAKEITFSFEAAA